MPVYNLPQRAGIYLITNLTNGHLYVGSAVDMRKRQREHLWGLHHGVHRSSYLQRAFNKYGETAFAFSVLEEVADVTILIEREQYHLDLLKPVYNSREKAESQLGLKHSEESKAKMSDRKSTRLNS